MLKNNIFENILKIFTVMKQIIMNGDNLGTATIRTLCVVYSGMDVQKAGSQEERILDEEWHMHLGKTQLLNFVNFATFQF